MMIGDDTDCGPSDTLTDSRALMTTGVGVALVDDGVCRSQPTDSAVTPINTRPIEASFTNDGNLKALGDTLADLHYYSDGSSASWFILPM
jgi:hypothetical protein